MIWKLRPSMRGERVASPIPRNFSSRSLQDFQSRLHRFDVSNPGLARSLLQQNFVPHYVTIGDESKMNRGRKSRRPQAISTENFAGKFTLAYLMAPLHHQRYCRPHDKVIRCCLPALTLMMRNHVRDTRSAKAFMCNVIRCAQLE